MASKRDVDDLGALTLFGLRAFLLFAPIALFGGIAGVSTLAPIQQMFYALPVMAAAAVAPRRAWARIPVSITLTMLLIWMGLSALWTINSAATYYTLRQELSLAIAVILTVGLLPLDEFFKWFLRGIKLLLVISVVAVAFDPDARTTVEFVEVEERWEAWFQSKNQFGRFCVLSLMTLFVFEKNLVSRIAWSGLAVFLILGSGSATSLAGMVIVGAAFVWVRRYQNVGDDWNGVFLLTSFIALVVAVIAAFLSVAAVVDALGRDLTFTGRTAVWDASIEYFEAEPWLGYGYDALWLGEGQEAFALERQIGYRAAHAHNGALNVALGIGIPGVVLFFGLFVSTLSLSLSHLRTSPYAMWAFLFLLMQLVFGSFESTYLGDWLGMMIVARLGMSKLQAARREQLEAEADLMEVLRPTFTIDLDSDPHLIRR